MFSGLSEYQNVMYMDNFIPIWICKFLYATTLLQLGLLVLGMLLTLSGCQPGQANPLDLRQLISAKSKTKLWKFRETNAFRYFVSGAPNENMIHNHLNIALLNVF